MAPRTREQQDAYNEKRRRESAEKRGAPPPAPKGKAPAKKAKAKAKVNGHAPPKAKPKKVRVVKSAAHVRDLGLGKGVLVVPGKPLHKKQGKEFDAAFYGKHGMTPEDALARGGKPTTLNVPELAKSIPEHKIEDARTSMIQPKLASIQQTKLPDFTLAGSYVRKTGAGKGKLRNGTHQCTVAFTTEQMNWLVAKAGFKLVSLAEMIRICVCERMIRGTE